MPHELEYIVKDALMMCDKGAMPAPFSPTYNTSVKISSCLVSTKADKIPTTNIPPFGACSVTGSTCSPAPIDWLDTYKVKVKGQETILFKSKLPCSVGGKIEFITSGQVPIPPEEMDALLEEHGEEEDDGWGWWDTVELIPVIGSIVGAVREGAKGNWGMMALNVGFLVMDVAGLVSFGATTAISTAAKTGIKVGVKATAKAAAKKGLQSAAKLGTKQGVKAVGKGFAKAAAKKVDDIVKVTGKVCVFACFPAGTKIHTKNGLKNIENIIVGDLVWSWNERNEKIELKRVLNFQTAETDVIIELHTLNDIIRTTPTHPFKTDNEWKDAAELEIGDTVKTFDGTSLKISRVNHVPAKENVFNFSVEDFHTYYVGENLVLVHNACYKATFFALNPLLKGKVVVHHAVEQQVLKKWPGLFDDVFMHSIDNLRGIPKSLNNTLHLSSIRKDWNRFYDLYKKSGTTPSKQSVLDYAKHIDKKYGHLFDPPLK